MKFPITLVVLSLFGMVAGYQYGYRSDFVAHPSSQADSSGASPEKTRTLSLRRSGVDPHELISKLNATREFKARKATLTEVKDKIDAFSEEEIRSILAILPEVEDGQAHDELAITLLVRFAEINYEAAFQFTNSGEFDRRVRQLVFPAIIRAAVAVSPSHGFEFWKSAKGRVEHSDELRPGLIDVFREWGKADLSKAFQEASKLENSGDFPTALNALFSYDPQHPGERERLLEFAGKLPSSKERTQASAEIVKTWSRTEQDLGEIENWLSRQEFSNDQERAELERAIAEPRLERDPESAASWLLSQATEETYSGHLGQVVDRWSRLQPDACAKWLHEFDLGPETDEAVAKLAENLDDDEPSYAFEWAQAIHDPETRRQSMEEIMQVWNRIDQTTARQFLKNHADLDEGERELLEKWLK